MTVEVWQSLTTWSQVRIAGKAIMGPLAAITALGGALVAVVDGGATLFVSYSLVGSLSAAIPGIAASATSAAGVATTVVASKMETLGREFNTLPALTVLFAMACDAFGVPRQSGQKTEVEFEGKRYPLHRLIDVPEHAAICRLAPDLGIWRMIGDVYQCERSLDD
jgi:hypothetical protein